VVGGGNSGLIEGTKRLPLIDELENAPGKRGIPGSGGEGRGQGAEIESTSRMEGKRTKNQGETDSKGLKREAIVG